jgi:hypothetical protein
MVLAINSKYFFAMETQRVFREVGEHVSLIAVNLSTLSVMQTTATKGRAISD